MGLILATLSSVVYGFADFCGGKATRRASTWTVTASSQLAGLVTVLVCLPFAWGEGPSVRAVGLGAIGGIAGAVGIMFLYHGLAHGTMSIVSPVTAVVASLVPVLFGVVVLDERPGTVPLIGIFFALAAVALVSASGGGGRDAHLLRTVRWAVGAGLGFGTFFVLLQRVGDDAGAWPLVGARPVSIALASLVAMRSRQPILVPRSAWPLSIAAGALDMVANLLFIFAAARGDLAVIAVLASLYPVSTVALARIVDREVLRPVQAAGLVFAFAALALIAA